MSVRRGIASGKFEKVVDCARRRSFIVLVVVLDFGSSSQRVQLLRTVFFERDRIVSRSASAGL